MHRGFIKVWRKISENPLWNEEKFTSGQAWLDLILMANHKDGTINVRGNIVTIKRGHVGWSEDTLAKKWKWSRCKVRRFKNRLETIQQIVQHRSPVLSTVEIVNYGVVASSTITPHKLLDSHKKTCII